MTVKLSLATVLRYQDKKLFWFVRRPDYFVEGFDRLAPLSRKAIKKCQDLEKGL